MSRNDISFEQIGVERITVKLDTGITSDDEGKAVTLVDNETVGLGNDGDPVHGKLVKVEDDGFGAVEYKGFVTFDFVSGAAPGAGEVAVVDGAGKVKVGVEASMSLKHKTNSAWSIDSTNQKVILLLG